MIELRDVSVSFGAVDAVHKVSLTVESGEWIALIGPNGAGKTSVLRALCRLVAFRGDIELDGRSVLHMSRRELARVIAFVPQTPVIPLELTVAEYVLLGRTPYLAYLGDESRDDRAAAQRALERLELRSFADRPLGSLRSDGLTVVSTMHDLTLAGQYADRLLLLDRGAVVAAGAPADVLSSANLESYYGASVHVIEDERGIFVLPLRR